MPGWREGWGSIELCVCEDQIATNPTPTDKYDNTISSARKQIPPEDEDSTHDVVYSIEEIPLYIPL